jgi:mono/diheme cytochrome c family protein
MKPWKAILLVLLILVVAVAAYGAILVRHGFSALAAPSALEEFTATTARNLALPSEYRQLRNPLPPSPDNLHRGMAHFADHCATCHANDGSGQTVYGKGMYPKPPDFRAAATQSRSDGELYYTIANGVRLSGMPAFSAIHTPEQSWRLVLFIRHLPHLTPEELAEMKALNRKPQSSPADW